MKTKLLTGALAAGAMLVTLGAGVAHAAPPPPPNFQFGITIGNPPPPPPHGHGPHGPPPPDDDCEPIKAIFSDLADDGYSHFRNYQDADDDYFFVDARRGTRLYRLTVDSCDGDILNRKRLYQPF